MGNVPDKTVDPQFMLKTEAMCSEFLSEQPLFHVEEIKFPLSTNQMKIVDATGRRVKLAGGNWSGGHMCRHTVDGLECRTLREIAEHIRFKFKMNCIRLTYSLQLYFDNNVIDRKYLLANPDLIGKTSMEIFDITIQTLTDVGLMVILNNHTSTSQWCCSNDDGDGLWWSREYPEYKFFQSTEQLAQRYANNQRVIGIDLRNQLRKAHGIDPTWGDGNARTDWKRAAKISGQLALKKAPHWLVFVSGLNYQLDLSAVKESPLEYSVPNKLVYTGHFYGFSWPIPSWNVYTYDNFKKRLFNTQTYVRSLGYPYLLGEFGNNQQDIPWKYLMKYIDQTGIDWTYWALDGFKCDRDKDQTYGVFTNDFSTARHPEMLEDLIKVGPPRQALETYQKYEREYFERKKSEKIGEKKAPVMQEEGNLQHQKDSSLPPPLMANQSGNQIKVGGGYQQNVGYQNQYHQQSNQPPQRQQSVNSPYPAPSYGFYSPPPDSNPPQQGYQSYQGQPNQQGPPNYQQNPQFGQQQNYQQGPPVGNYQQQGAPTNYQQPPKQQQEPPVEQKPQNEEPGQEQQFEIMQVYTKKSSQSK